MIYINISAKHLCKTIQSTLYHISVKNLNKVFFVCNFTDNVNKHYRAGVQGPNLAVHLRFA